MKILEANEIHVLKVSELGLDPSKYKLDSIEAISGALRRAVNILSPCTTSKLVQRVVQPMRGLVDDSVKYKITVEETLDALIANGDIIESRDFATNTPLNSSNLLYAAPVAFVSLKNGRLILLGSMIDNNSLLPTRLASRIENQKHLRILRSNEGENLENELTHFGQIQISEDNWLKKPANRLSGRLIEQIDSLLDSTAPSGDIQGLKLLDSERSVKYYRGRWADPGKQSGRFVARRDQAFGAPLWCYVQLSEGKPQLLIDFPVKDSLWRGCDEAWHLQLAIDANRGKPQMFSISNCSDDTSIMKFFSPIPKWAQRRWDSLGEPISDTGCLFAYRIAQKDIMVEILFAKEALWLSELTENSN